MGVFIDSHCDTPTRLIKGADFFVKDSQGQYDYDSMVCSGVDCVFMALYTPNDMGRSDAMLRVMEMLAAVNDVINRSGGRLRLAVSADEIESNSRDGVRSIALGMENASPLGDSLQLLDLFYSFGVRYVTLTHNGNNQICDAASAGEILWGGLSPFGKDFIKRMNDIGMMIDISHLSDDSVRDILEISRVPVIASHSCVRALSDHPRNLNDSLIKAVASAGGVIQVNFYPPFLDSTDTEVSYRSVADHIDYIVSLVGIEHVGIGSDFDGIDSTPSGLGNISEIGNLFNELRLRGYSDEALSLIRGENFLRVFRLAEKGKILL